MLSHVIIKNIAHLIYSWTLIKLDAAIFQISQFIDGQKYNFFFVSNMIIFRSSSVQSLDIASSKASSKDVAVKNAFYDMDNLL